MWRCRHSCVCLITVSPLSLKTWPGHFLFCVVSTSFCHLSLSASVSLCLSQSLAPPLSWCQPPVCVGPPKPILCLFAACHVQCVSRAMVKEIEQPLFSASACVFVCACDLQQGLRWINMYCGAWCKGLTEAPAERNGFLLRHHPWNSSWQTTSLWVLL